MARLPYQLIVAVAFIVFPLLSAPAVKADKARTERYVSATLRYSLIAMLGLVAALGFGHRRRCVCCFHRNM